MKLRSVLIAGVVMLTGLAAMAQDAPKFEAAIDYSYARYTASHNFASSYSLNGGGGELDFNFTKYLGIKGDFQGYGSNTQRFTAPAGSSRLPTRLQRQHSGEPVHLFVRSANRNPNRKNPAVRPRPPGWSALQRVRELAEINRRGVLQGSLRQFLCARGGRRY